MGKPRRKDKEAGQGSGMERLSLLFMAVLRPVAIIRTAFDLKKRGLGCLWRFV